MSPKQFKQWDFFPKPTENEEGRSIQNNHIDRESLISGMLMLHHQPLIHVVNIHPHPSNHIQPLTTTATTTHSQALTNHYSKYGHNSFYLQTAIINVGFNYKA